MYGTGVDSEPGPLGYFGTDDHSPGSGEGTTQTKHAGVMPPSDGQPVEQDPPRSVCGCLGRLNHERRLSIAIDEDDGFALEDPGSRRFQDAKDESGG
jgi:hypothetical protein